MRLLKVVVNLHHLINSFFFKHTLSCSVFLFSFHRVMNSIAVDQVDSGINNFVFEKDKTEKADWELCNKKIPRSEVVFFTQIFLFFC